MEKLNIQSQQFSIINKSTFEVLAAQFQPFTNKIICVKDGVDLFLWNPDEIPENLKRERQRIEPNTSIIHYSYRSAVDDSLYTFFNSDIDKWLLSNRTMKPSIAQPPIQQPPVSQSIISQQLFFRSPPTIERESTWNTINPPTFSIGSNRKELKSSTVIRDNTLTITESDVLVGKTITISINDTANMKKRIFSLFN